MVRTQIQIDNDTYEALRNAAHRQRKSISEVARVILKERLVQGTGSEKALAKKFTFIGSGSSKEKDISVRHDDYLAEDFS